MGCSWEEEGGSIPWCPTWAWEMHLLFRSTEHLKWGAQVGHVLWDQPRWVTSCGISPRSPDLLCAGRSRGAWQLVLCWRHQAELPPVPLPEQPGCPSPGPRLRWVSHTSLEKCWGSLTQLGPLKAVLVRFVLEAPGRAAGVGMMVLGAPWRCSCCCLALRGCWR